MRRPILTCLIAAITLTLISAIIGPVQAAGNLVLNPTRLVLDDRTNHGSVTLINTGNETTTYRISFVRMRMTDEGRLVTIHPDEPINPNEAFADSFTIFSPRQVTLGPGTSQIIRLAIRKPAGLAEGEYRSHLLVQALPPAGSEPDLFNEQSGDQLAIQLRAIFGVSIPVIVRHGATSAQVGISDLELISSDHDSQILRMRLNRSGNRSLYGDVRVTYQSDSGEVHDVGILQGIAAYVPLTSRYVQMELQPLPTGPISKGKLRVTFEERQEYGGSLIAEEWLDL